MDHAEVNKCTGWLTSRKPVGPSPALDLLGGHRVGLALGDLRRPGEHIGRRQHGEGWCRGDGNMPEIPDKAAGGGSDNVGL